MPGILPRRVVMGSCENCRKQGLICDYNSPTCSRCASGDIICTRVECSRDKARAESEQARVKGIMRIEQTCDRCRNKRIRCDGIRPTCTQCANLGLECKASERLGRRAFPRGYTESLEQKIYSMDAEAIALKHQLDQKDEQICQLSFESTSHAKITQQSELVSWETKKERSKPAPRIVAEPAVNGLHISTWEIEKRQSILNNSTTAKQESLEHTGVSQWIDIKTGIAEGTMINPTTNLLIVEMPDNPTEDLVKSHTFYDEVLVLVQPALAKLGISNNILGAFSSVIFDKSPASFPSENQNENTALTFTYHIAIGNFSLAFRYFPKSRSCVGILIVQNYADIAAELLHDLHAHQLLIGEPLLLALLAQKAITKLVTSWLTQHKATIIEAQAQTGFHHMVSLRKSTDFVDYTELSAKISGTAVNIATNELCWHALVDHALFMVEELHKHAGALQPASFMQSHAARLARNAQSKLHEAASWQQKALILTQGIFNLIAQQDQNTSIGIARDSKSLTAESKRDSTSMKAIAIVTMTYLPASFVASLFSMSIFKWDATDGVGVVSHRFWVYWAVTVPLVVVTFLVWILWLRYRMGKKTMRGRPQ